MKKFASKNYINKVAVDTSNFDFNEEELEMPKPSKKYYASLGVTILITPTGDVRKDTELAYNAFSDLKEQIGNANISMDTYEAYLSGNDEYPDTMQNISKGLLG